VAAAIDDCEPDVVLNAAGFTGVDRAEDEDAEATRVNGSALSVIGEECARRGVTVVHFSSDYVFDGDSGVPYREDDPTNPVNAYGRSKLAGERALGATGARALVLRVQWLFGGRRESFPSRMWKRAVRGERTRVVDDQVGSPTYTTDLAGAVWKLVALDETGVLHLASSGTASWYDVARAVFAHAGRPDLLQRCSTAEFPTRTRRPKFTVLDTSRAAALLGAPLPAWDDALQRYLRDIAGPAPGR
jgi:dTDP-4-dehydrorhamnose reductase